MRKKIVAGNWKMNTLLKDGMELAKAVEKLEKEKQSDALAIIAPPYTHLSRVNDCSGGPVNRNSFSNSAVVTMTDFTSAGMSTWRRWERFWREQ